MVTPAAGVFNRGRRKNGVMLGGLIAMLPVVRLYIFPRKYCIHGFTIGGVKERFLVPAEVPTRAPGAQGGPIRHR